MELTTRQSEVLAMITAFRAEHGFAPSTRDIQRHFGFASQTAAMTHLRKLRSKGAVDWSPGRGRTVSTGGVSHLPSSAPKFVYFFHDSVSGHVKIGRSSNIQQRKITLETAYPCRLTLICLLPADEWPERPMHRLFKADRLRGEWFRYSDHMKAFVASHQPDESTSRS